MFCCISCLASILKLLSWLPISTIVWYMGCVQNIDKIGLVSCPVLVMHVSSDDILWTYPPTFFCFVDKCNFSNVVKPFRKRINCGHYSSLVFFTTVGIIDPGKIPLENVSTKKFMHCRGTFWIRRLKVLQSSGLAVGPARIGNREELLLNVHLIGSLVNCRVHQMKW